MTTTSTANPGGAEPANAAGSWWRDPGKRWIGVVLILLLGNVGMVGMLMIAAGPADARRVIPDYYQRAATYDREIAQRGTNRQMGLSTRIVATASTWTLGVRGRNGAVTDARVGVAIRHRSRPELDRAIVLTPASGGYETALALPVGLYDVEVTIETAAGKFIDTQEVEIKP
ncbi:MAG: FixH family protein [Myxococcales bacterium]|nr:FixH family protein [Myxococcales bacterium]